MRESQAFQCLQNENINSTDKTTLIRYQVNRTCILNLYTHTATDKRYHSNTVLLPKTKLPLRLNGKKLIDRDKLLSCSSQFVELYQWQRKHLDGNEFILHDGPPYANGVPHMGHAINKILKDVILRNNTLQGKRVHYVPGWDCHGLPIELKAIANSKDLDALEIRQKARIFASEAIAKQKEAFISWGVIGDWNQAYTTYHPSYIKNQIKQFYNLYQKKLVYRDMKPVYWSPSSKTALAEAELEYKTNHKSTAVTVKVKLHSGLCIASLQEQVFALIWTTTPWTLPSNQAICYNPKLSYSIVQNMVNNEYYLLATNLITDISNKVSAELRIVRSLEGTNLKDISYIHPIYRDKILYFVPASHAVETKGTGLVHTAPAHGPEDYLVALENNMDILSIVNENGRFTSRAGTHLENLYVLSDGTQAILKLLGNDLLHTEEYVHSYPYDWRTNKPVIIRASKQWFIDTNSIKQKALELLKNVKIIPEIHSEVYRHHFESQLQKRPYWCISRQRSWGVPIPVFYLQDTDEVIINEHTIEAICNFVKDSGCDFWWKLSVKEIFQEISGHNLSLHNIKKGEDILDIWFDSGLSWSNVLPDKQVADLYIEGVDQFTGWFQSSLLTSTALRNEAPYKTIYVHGFAVDEKGKKMSKSLGNVINPQDIMLGTKQQKLFGVDTLRWWVACHANQDSIAEVGTTVLQASNDEVQKLRSVLRFAVAGLYDYDSININYNELKLIDKYMLHLIKCYQKEAQEYLNNYYYHKLNAAVMHFLTNSVSALYYNCIKDRLYCDPQNSLSRRSAQYVLYAILQIVTRSIAAILPHLAEELYSHFPLKVLDSFFKTRPFNAPEDWYSEDVLELMHHILNFRKEINKQVGATGKNKHVEMFVNNRQRQKLQEYVDEENFSMEMADIFQVASVEIVDDTVSMEEYKVKITTSNVHNCPRCRRFLSKNFDELCYRCHLVVSNAKAIIVN
ncbi:hypothetical protein Trydic_g16709 [Trypoxylus dichotomus]